MCKTCTRGDPVSPYLKEKKKWYSLLRPNRNKQTNKQIDVFQFILPNKASACVWVPGTVPCLAEGGCGLPSIRAEAHVKVHSEGGKPKPRSWRPCSETSLHSLTRVRGQCSFLSIPLSSTKQSGGPEAQHKGKMKSLRSSTSLVILGEQFSTELVSRKQNTFP